MEMYSVQVPAICARLDMAVLVEQQNLKSWSLSEISEWRKLLLVRTTPWSSLTKVISTLGEEDLKASSVYQPLLKSHLLHSTSSFSTTKMLFRSQLDLSTL
jgi:hypothetical protein